MYTVPYDTVIHYSHEVEGFHVGLDRFELLSVHEYFFAEVPLPTGMSRRFRLVRAYRRTLGRQTNHSHGQLKLVKRKVFAAHELITQFSDFKRPVIAENVHLQINQSPVHLYVLSCH